MIEERRGAVVLRVEGETMFIPAGVALEVTSMPRVTTIAGAPSELLGIALHEGSIVPVLSVGSARTRMVLCTYLGEPVGVTGGDVLHVGLLPSAGEHGELVVHHGRPARLLDVGALYARVQAGSWMGRLGA
jgi:hypothetical protein